MPKHQPPRHRRIVLLAALVLLAGCGANTSPGVATAVSTSGTVATGDSGSATETNPGSTTSEPAESSTGPSPDTSSSSPAGPATESSTSDTARWSPTAGNPDPSVDIEGIYVGAPEIYASRYHFDAPTRVAYDRYPPVGGPHAPTWAECDGRLYDEPVRNENMVHALEHGAVWIAYNPDLLDAGELAELEKIVTSVPYLVASPYPGLRTPLSLQAWAHQLTLDAIDDERFVAFVLALLRNPYLTPEPNATCSNPNFDPYEAPFQEGTPGPGAVPLDFQPPPPTSGTG